MKFSEANRYPLDLRSPVSGAPTHEVLTEKGHHRYFFYKRAIYQKFRSRLNERNGEKL